MPKKKKLTPAQREKKLQAAAEKKKAQKKASVIAVCIAVIAALAVIAIGIVIANGGFVFTSATSQSGTTLPAAQTIQTDPLPTGDGATLETAVATHYATIEIQNYGTIKLELYGNTAPITVQNFVTLAESGFYEGLTFHRIIEGFMMQGGAPNGESPEIANIVGEFASNGIENNLLHERGVISMARSSVMNSASSQFFIMHATKPHLNGDYAAFGKVIEGIEVVDKVCNAAQPIDGNGGIAPAAQPVITSVTVTPA